MDTHNPQFPPTSWTMFHRAVRNGDGPDADVALNTLCRGYWYPLYAFARRMGQSHEDAQDQTQIFLTRLSHGNMLDGVQASKGRLRVYLLKAFQWQLLNAKEHERALRRGGGVPLVSLGMQDAADRFARESPDPGLTPEENFDRNWAMLLLDACLASLYARYADRQQEQEFLLLRPFLSPFSAGDACIAGVAEKLGISTAAARQRISRLRAGFSKSLRQHVADSLAVPTEAAVEEELHSLRRALQY